MTRHPMPEDCSEEARRAISGIPSKGRILAVDPGKRRWGFALSDPSQSIVGRFWTEELPLKIAGARIAEIVATNGAVAVVLGLAVRQDGSEGELASIARRIGAYLERKGIARFYWDESLTTRLAETALSEVSRSRKAPKSRLPAPSATRSRLDGLSAAILLEYYLRYLQTIRAPGPE